MSASPSSLVYLLLPTYRETLQGGFLEVFNLISGQFSVYFPGKISEENPRKSLFYLLISFTRPLKGPNKPVRVATWSVFHAESESGVKQAQIQRPGAKIYRNQDL